MGDKTKIEWADATWNPVTGCTPVSAGCRNCYAERMVKRFPGLHNAAVPTTMARRDSEELFREIRFHSDRLDQPLRWKKPRRIFVCSMGDFWHPDVSPMQRVIVFETIRKCPQHTFVLLTKRAKEMYDDLVGNTMMRGFASLPNLIGMVTAENQPAADERIRWLLRVPFALRGVSVEPMLGPVEIFRGGCPHPVQTERGVLYPAGALSWVICGGESGTNARPMHPDWPRSLRDQCQAAGVPFFYKGGKLDNRSHKAFPEGGRG